MSFSQHNGFLSDTSAIQIAPANSVVMSRQTLDFGGVDSFRVDSSRLEPKKTYTPVIKTFPYIPVDDTIEHPTYDVLTGSFIIEHDGSIASQLKINPIQPISDSALEENSIVAVEPPKTSTKPVSKQEAVAESPSTPVLIQVEEEPTTDIAIATDTVIPISDTTLAIVTDSTATDTSVVEHAQKVLPKKKVSPYSEKLTAFCSTNRWLTPTG